MSPQELLYHVNKRWGRRRSCSLFFVARTKILRRPSLFLNACHSPTCLWADGRRMTKSAVTAIEVVSRTKASSLGRESEGGRACRFAAAEAWRICLNLLQCVLARKLLVKPLTRNFLIKLLPWTPLTRNFNVKETFPWFFVKQINKGKFLDKINDEIIPC